MENILFVVCIGIAIIALLASIIFAALAPHYEAKAFNECTGGNATYFTAMFTELRIENCNR